jgi:hypothetical protein
MTLLHPRRVNRSPSMGEARSPARAQPCCAIPEPPLEDVTVAAGALLDRLERAVRRFRLQSTHNLLDEAFASHSPEVVLRDIGRPLLNRLEVSGDDAEERFARSVLELRLLAQARDWERVNGPLVVLASADENVLELVALGIALAERRCRITYLGATTPVEALLETVRHQHAAVAVLSTARGTLSRYDVSELKELGCPLVTIGAARTAVAKAAGGEPLDTRAATTAAHVAGLARRESSRGSDEPSPS